MSPKQWTPEPHDFRPSAKPTARAARPDSHTNEAVQRVDFSIKSCVDLSAPIPRKETPEER